MSGRSSGSWGDGGDGEADGENVRIAVPRGVYVAGGGRRWGDEGSVGEEYYGYGDMRRVSYESERSGGGRRGSWGV